MQRSQQLVEEQRRKASEALGKRTKNDYKMQSRASVPGATTKVAAAAKEEVKVPDEDDPYGGWSAVLWVGKEVLGWGQVERHLCDGDTSGAR